MQHDLRSYESSNARTTAERRKVPIIPILDGLLVAYRGFCFGLDVISEQVGRGGGGAFRKSGYPDWGFP